jgi:hypothetical protein
LLFWLRRLDERPWRQFVLTPSWGRIDRGVVGCQVGLKTAERGQETIVTAGLGGHQKLMISDVRGRRLRRRKRQFQVIDDPVHGPELRDETEAKSRISFLC